MNIAAILLALTACSDPPALNVEVVDIWGDPIPEATVKQETVVTSVTTDAKGKVSIEVSPGTVHVMAGKDGYIKDFTTVQILEDADEDASAKLSLYPEPASPGFFGVGAKKYVELRPESIEAVASEMSTYHGVKNVPSYRFAAAEKQRFVFNTTLSSAEISRQDLKLSKLKFEDKVQVTSVLGAAEVKLDLWVADTDVEYEVRPMQSKDDFLLLTPKLEAGVYAFHAQGILHNTNAKALEKLPKELQVAFPFEVK